MRAESETRPLAGFSRFRGSEQWFYLFACLKEIDRIDRPAVFADFIVQMTAGGASGTSCLADNRSGGNLLTVAYQNAAQMGKTGRESITMIDFDHVAITAKATCLYNLARCGGLHRLTVCCAKVDTGMERSRT